MGLLHISTARVTGLVIRPSLVTSAGRDFNAYRLLGAKELVQSANVHKIIMEVESIQYSDMLQGSFNSLKDAGYMLSFR